MASALGLALMKFVEASLAISHVDTPLIHAAIDGSGTGRFISYGAVYGPAPAWALLWDDWAKLLDEYQVDHIRMAHAMSFNGAFEEKREEWGERKEETRNALLMRAAKLIRESKCRVIGLHMDFEKFPPKSYRPKKAMMFALLVRALLQQQKDPESVLAFMCDDEQDVAVDYYKFLTRFKRHFPKLAPRVAGLCFYNDTRVYQLQAADMAAYVHRENAEGISNPLYPVIFDGADRVVEQVNITFSRDTPSP